MLGGLFKGAVIDGFLVAFGDIFIPYFGICIGKIIWQKHYCISKHLLTQEYFDIKILLKFLLKMTQQNLKNVTILLFFSLINKIYEKKQ
ncbi:hypothetical protein MOMA_01420 [Moraxella macacae 0408225]|uniref:Uncharacterized protein n=1 Tax=Moraxella macacae 0408225 TaxID=1230338 RepID=L2F7M1_9GAMM|nr:hypothetical protein MOMA_01420 [Moraxella macacae 0408225]